MSNPIVAIVGRPNVGKSKLFNKLAGKRIAIVEDTPGVTRDRIYAQAEWLNYNFTIIDTGGIEPETSDIITVKMRMQAEIAIETADVIIFLVDGKEGLCDSDNEVANMLRKSGKPVVLVVNKIDTMDEEGNAYEFYSLGIGNPITISASQGLGLGDMLDAVVGNFKKDTTENIEEEYMKLAVVGKPNVGKSSLINRLLGEERVIVSNIPGTTRDSIDSYLESDIGKFILVDTAGLRKRSKIKEEIERYSAVRTFAAIEKCDVCLLIIDANEEISEQDQKIIGYAHELNKAIMIAINKWDTIDKDQNTTNEFKRQIGIKLNFLSYAPYIFISAKTGQRVGKVLELAKKCYDNYTRRISTGVINEVINRSVLMKEPPVVGFKRLKIFYVTQTGIKPPTFVFFVNSQDAIHFSYERYLENQIRTNFDFEGTGIKLEFRERKE